MNAKELHDWFAGPSPVSGMDAEDKQTILRALSLLAAAEANDGTTLETDALMLKHLTELVWPRDPRLVPDAYDLAQSIEAKHYRELRDHASRLERERNGLAAEVLRLQEQLQAAEKEAHRKDVLLVEAIYGQPCPTQRQWEQMQELVAKAFASRGKP